MHLTAIKENKDEVLRPCKKTKKTYTSPDVFPRVVHLYKSLVHANLDVNLPLCCWCYSVWFLHLAFLLLAHQEPHTWMRTKRLRRVWHLILSSFYMQLKKRHLNLLHLKTLKKEPLSKKSSGNTFWPQDVVFLNATIFSLVLPTNQENVQHHHLKLRLIKLFSTSQGNPKQKWVLFPSTIFLVVCQLT